MAQNLNVGTSIPCTTNQTNNASIEKYCYTIDEVEYCNIYGGLYQWDEMMQYVTTEGVQGICPVGWHIPTNLEWCELEYYVDNTIDPDCEDFGMRGTDAGGDLKQFDDEEYIYWDSPNTGATDAYGFTALPGGTTSSTPSFININTHGEFWTSTENSELTYPFCHGHLAHV